MKKPSVIKLILYIGIILCMLIPGAIQIETTLVTGQFDGGWAGRIVENSKVSMLGAVGKMDGLNGVLIIALLAISVFGVVSCWRESNGKPIGNENSSLYIAIAEGIAIAASWISIYCNYDSDFYLAYSDKYHDRWDVDTVFYLVLAAVCAVLGVSIWDHVTRKRS